MINKHNCINNRNIKSENYAQNAQKDIPNKYALVHTGLVSITFRKLSVFEIVGLVKQAGLDGIEWGGDIHVPHGDIAKAREVRSLCVEHDVAIPAYGSYYKAGHSENEGLSFSSVLDSACELGTSTIRVWAGKTGSEKATAEVRDKTVADLLRIADLALTENITISLEYHGGTLTDTDLSVRQLMKELNNKHNGINNRNIKLENYAQNAQKNISNKNALMHSNILFYWQPPVGFSVDKCSECLKTVLPKLGNIHVFHWELDGKGELERLPLTEGKDQWRRYFSEIEKNAVHLKRYAMLEFVKGESQEQFLKDAAALKDIVSACSKRFSS
jgi:xylose isomerase-like TIM barrel protein